MTNLLAARGLFGLSLAFHMIFAASGSLIVGWAAAQYPALVVPDVTLSQAAAPARTQVALLVALGLVGVTLLPSLWLLSRVFKARPRLGSPTDADAATEPATHRGARV